MTRIAETTRYLLATIIGFTIVATPDLGFAQAPAAPSDVVAQASAPGDLAIFLFWNDNALDETGFEIQRAVGDSPDFEVLNLGTTSNVGSYADVGLAENTRYRYRVRAYNAAGFSAFSNVGDAITSFARPLQVSGLAGTFVDHAVRLTWVDESNNETRFEVERAEIGVSTAFETIAVLDPDTTAYTDTTALDGTTYTYRIVPWRFDVAGGAPLTVELATGAPIAPPRDVRGRGESRTAIELKWQGHFAPSAVIHIQRFELDTGIWTTLSETPASFRRYVDTGLSPRTTYSYRVRVIGATAVSPFVSVTATTR